MIHTPVLKKEVLEYLNPKSDENFIDGTVGQGGHARSLLKKTGPSGLLLGLDLDAGQIENSSTGLKDFNKRVILVNDSYANVSDVVERLHFYPVNGMLLDLGYSSWQLENSQKGFSFLKDEVLDMRYSLQDMVTAEKIVNEYSEDEIKKILQEYGQERFARQIARAIVRQRKMKKIETTFELNETIAKAIPGKFQHGKIHYATKSFQALRIATNHELENVETFLPKAVSLLPAQGRLVVISFHSLEDRIIKNFFKTKEREGIVTILTKKPIIASSQEVMENPRARSAKLRALIKI
jgi:16S rRNA (cytosine1402-N4)-methyltransferase